MIYVMNAATLGISAYTGLPLINLVEHDRELYRVSADWLCQFTGSDDNGTAIAWKLETGLAEHGSQRDKGFARAYVLARTSGDLRLTTLVNRDGAQREISYSVPKRGGDLPMGRTVKLGRGVQGTAWGWRLEGDDGADVDLEGFEVFPVMHQRRR